MVTYLVYWYLGDTANSVHTHLLCVFSDKLNETAYNRKRWQDQMHLKPTFSKVGEDASQRCHRVVVPITLNTYIHTNLYSAKNRENESEARTADIK